jgi:hypothetical protein
VSLVGSSRKRFYQRPPSNLLAEYLSQEQRKERESFRGARKTNKRDNHQQYLVQTGTSKKERLGRQSIMGARTTRKRNRERGVNKGSREERERGPYVV